MDDLPHSVIEAAGNLLFAWAIAQVRMREIATRGTWSHVSEPGVVVFWDPGAIR